MRISLEYARRLGLKVPGLKKPAKAKSAEREKVAKGRGKKRLPVGDYGSKVLRFDVDLPDDPQPKERPRTVINMKAIIQAFIEAKGSVARFKELIKGKTSHTYTPKNTADYEDLILKHATVAMADAQLKPFDCPVKTHIHFVFKGEQDTWPTSPGDGDKDNLEKAVLDALNKVVYADDRLVVRSFTTKSCGEKPRLVVKVSPVSRRIKQP